MLHTWYAQQAELSFLLCMEMARGRKYDARVLALLNICQFDRNGGRAALRCVGEEESSSTAAVSALALARRALARIYELPKEPFYDEARVRRRCTHNRRDQHPSILRTMYVVGRSDYHTVLVGITYTAFDGYAHTHQALLRQTKHPRHMAG